MREPDGVGGVKELLLALIGILVPALIGYAVYIYRPRVGFISQGEARHFSVEDGRIAHGTVPFSTEIEIGTVELRNTSQSDIEGFKIVFEINSPQTDFRVSRTSTLANSAVVVRCDDTGIYVEIERFPAKEKILFSYSTIGRSGLAYRFPKKVGGKFNIYSIDAKQRALKYVFIGMSYVLIPIFSAIVVGWSVSQFLDLF